MIARALRNLPIKRKLTAIILCAAGAALVTALAAFLLFQVRLARENAARDLTALARIVAANAAGPLAFGDRDSGRATLESLRARTDIESARLTDSSGEEFGRFDFVEHPYKRDTFVTAPTREASLTIAGFFVVVDQPVIHAGEILGRLELVANLRAPLLNLAANGALIGLLILALALGFAVLLVARLQKSITEPLSALSSAARAVASERDYRVRVPRTSDDETGELTSAFNHMLEQVELREDDLGATKQQLAAQVLVLQREIGERERVETELKHAKEIAESANRAKSSFLATMSHEIRTPMNGVLATASLLLDSPLNDEQRELAGLIRVSGDGLLTVLNDILDFSKLEAGHVQLEQTEFDLRDLIEDAVELYAVAAAGKGLTVAADSPPDLITAVRGDPHRLRQVLMNFVGNAVKFTARGEVVVSLSCDDLNPDRPVYRIEISDSGIGLSPEAQARLFQPFSQADSSMSRRFGGTGLGLAICKGLIELMGGTVGVRSQLGSGSTFWFTLPLRQIAGITPIRHIVKGLANGRLLVVDPHEGNRQRLRRQLAAWSVDAVETTDAAGALAAVTQSSPDAPPLVAALICLAPADGPGLALAQALRAEPAWANRPVILLTNQTERLAARGLSAEGVSACLFRPMRMRQLAATLQRLLCPPENPRAEIETPASASGEVALRVLLVEDNAVNQRVATLMLRKHRCIVTYATDGRQALTFLSQQRFALVLMDCQMPELDGFEATRQIRAAEAAGLWGKRPSQFIVAMTANAMEGDRERCLAAGMDDYIAKPMNAHNLESVIRRASQNEKTYSARSPQNTA